MLEWKKRIRKNKLLASTSTHDQLHCRGPGEDDEVPSAPHQDHNNEEISPRDGNEETVHSHDQTANNLVNKGNEQEDHLPDEGGLEEYTPFLQQQEQERGASSVHNILEREHGILPKDTISLLVSVKPGSPGFILAVSTITVQVVVLILLSIDSIELDGSNEYPKNWLQVPATLEIQVTLAQFLALTIASLSQYDVVQAIILIYVGFDPSRIQQGIDGDLFHPEYLKLRWCFSVFMRFGIGFSTTVVTFMLVAQSETVRDVMLDFTAIEFVSQLDEVMFVLASIGFFGNHIKRVTSFKVYDDSAITKDVRIELNLFTWKWLNKTVIFYMRTITFWVNISLLMIIAIRQYTGFYVPDTLLVQMGDERAPLLSTYTGIYELRTPRLGQIEYAERGGDGVFKWCDPEQSWTFLKLDDLDCAQDWTLKSVELDQYGDMLTVANEPWFILEKNNIKVEVQHLRMFSMLGVNVDDCGERDNSTRFGWTCDFVNPCSAIEVDANTGPFIGQRTWPISFTMLPDVLVYRHPVYFHRENEFRNPDLIVFTGRQWAMITTTSWLDADLTEDEYVWTDEEIYNVLFDLRVYRYEANFGIHFLSELVDLGAKNDRGTPVGLQWFAVELGNNEAMIPDIDERITVSQQFFCAVCREKIEGRACFYGAPCVNATCICDAENLGSRCERVPSKDGICHPSFNNEGFDYDGGDCCSSSCEDTVSRFCLKSGEEQLVDIGNSLCRNRQPGFYRQLPLAEPDVLGEWQNAVTVAPGLSLTPDGHTFSASYRLIDSTVFGALVGTKWKQSGISHTFGGYHNEIASLFDGSIGGPARRLPIKGIAASYLSRGIFPYTCNALGCTLQRIGDSNSTKIPNNVVPAEFALSDYWDPFTLSSDGNVLARGVYLSETGSYAIDLYLSDTLSGWILSAQSLELTVNRTKITGSYFVPSVPSTESPISTTPRPTLAPPGYGVTVNASIPQSTDPAGAVPACEFLAIWFGLAVNAWSSVDLINNFPNFDASNLTAEVFESSVSDANVTDFDLQNFNVTQFIWDNCIPDLSEILLYEQSISRYEAPLYLSMSGLRPDGSRRIAVGSIKFEQRIPGELSGALATLVYEIPANGPIGNQPALGLVLDQSDFHAKSQNNATGIPKKAVSISDSGNHVVVGSLYLRNDDPGVYEAGIVKVFRWNNGVWETLQEMELGRNDTNPQIRDGWSNAMSSDGSILVIAFPLKSAIYRWNGTAYDLVSPELSFSPGTDVAVSLDGSVVGFAVPLRGGFGTFMYGNDGAPWCEQGETKELRISYTPLWKQNFTWRLFALDSEKEGEVIVHEGGWPVNSEPLGAAASEQHGTMLQSDPIRTLQLDIEREYVMDDPTDLTFVYTLCVEVNICTVLKLDVEAEISNTFGVVFDGQRILPDTSPAEADMLMCRLEFVRTS